MYMTIIEGVVSYMDFIAFALALTGENWPTPPYPADCSL